MLPRAFDVLWPLLVALLTLAASWGGARTTTHELERRVTALEGDRRALQELAQVVAAATAANAEQFRALERELAYLRSMLERMYPHSRGVQ